jgi:hypothetical protein
MIENKTKSFLDRVTGGLFKTAQDGRRLFFPWGVWGRGYVISSEQDSRRIKHQLGIFVIVSAALTVGAIILKGYLAATVIAGLLLVFFVSWKPQLVRGLQPSDERLSLKESYTSLALAQSSRQLWSWGIGALILSGVAIVALLDGSIGDSIGSRVTAALLLIISAVLAAFAGWMLVLRRQASRPQAPGKQT